MNISAQSSHWSNLLTDAKPGKGRKEIKKWSQDVHFACGPLSRSKSQLFFFSFFLNVFHGFRQHFFIHKLWKGGTISVVNGNLPNLTLTFCRSSVVEGIAVGALMSLELGRLSCSLSAAVVDIRCLMLDHCSCCCSGHAVLGVLGIDSVVVGLQQSVLAKQEFFDLRLQPQRRFSCEVRLVCDYEWKMINHILPAQTG